MVSVHDLLDLAIQERASDLLIKAGAAPAIRVDGRMAPTTLPPLTSEQTEELAQSIIYAASRDYLLRFKGSGPEKLQDLDVADEKMRQLRRPRSWISSSRSPTWCASAPISSFSARRSPPRSGLSPCSPSPWRSWACRASFGSCAASARG